MSDIFDFEAMGEEKAFPLEMWLNGEGHKLPQYARQAYEVRYEHDAEFRQKVDNYHRMIAESEKATQAYIQWEKERRSHRVQGK